MSGISDEGLGEESGPVGWGTAQPFLLWRLYQHYGDQRLLEENYEPAKRWLALLRSRAPDGILDNGISDHESLVPKPRALTGTAFYYFEREAVCQHRAGAGQRSRGGGSRGAGRNHQGRIQPQVPPAGHGPL